MFNPELIVLWLLMTFPIHFALIQVIHLLAFGSDHTTFSITLEDISYGTKHRKVLEESLELL